MADGFDDGLDSGAASGNADDSSQHNSSGADDKQGASDEKETPEQLLQRERSRHGRELASLKDSIATLQQTVASITNQTRASLPADDESPVKFITTPEELETYNAWKEKKMSAERKNYAREYVASVKSSSYLNPEFHAEIETELLDSTTQFGSHSNFKDAVYDAQTNYRIAESNVLKRKLAEAKGITPPSTRGGQNPPTGVTVSSSDIAGSGKKVTLDEDAKRFLKGMGDDEDADWVKKSLSRKDL
jgi:hypothetical protein